MKDTGLALAVLGALGFLAAFFLLPTSVDASFGGGEVTNLALQQRQLLAAMGSAAVFLAGVILYAAGAAAALNATGGDDAETMKRLGITHDAQGYHHGGFVYNSLSAAVAAAQR